MLLLLSFLQTHLDILYVLKYAGSIFSAVYGVYATLTDLKIDKGGQKVLSKKGYFGLSLLALGIVMNISADAIKDRREIKSQEDSDKVRNEMLNTETDNQNKLTAQIKSTAEVATTLGTTLSELKATSRVINRTASTTDEALVNTARVLYPIPETMAVSFTFVIPRQPTIFGYLDSLSEQRITRADGNSNWMGPNGIRPRGGVISFSSDDPNYPHAWSHNRETTQLDELLNIENVTINFFRDREESERDGVPAFSLTFGCTDRLHQDTSRGDISLRYFFDIDRPQDDELRFNCYSNAVKTEPVRFRSLLDFDRSYVVVALGEPTRDMKWVAKDNNEAPLVYNLELSLKTNDGHRVLSLGEFDLKLSKDDLSPIFTKQMINDAWHVL
jgi:hypothetical protein